MHDIWNPWHGCRKYSEGCLNCYMFFLDAQRDRDGAEIYRNKANFYYPLAKDKNGAYKVKSGEMIRVCMTSDFFLEEADGWRDEAWNVIRMRPDVKFFILTKRAGRIKDHLPSDWGDGYDNVTLNVTCENQRRADERIPILLSVPAKHKGIMCAPLIDAVSIKKYLPCGQIEQVLADGENYDGARLCRYEWVKALYDECVEYDVSFVFCGTGWRFEKDGKIYRIEKNGLQSRQAYLSGLNHRGKPIKFDLKDNLGIPIAEDELYKPFFGEKCKTCGVRHSCNGCSKCGKCDLPPEKSH